MPANNAPFLDTFLNMFAWHRAWHDSPWHGWHGMDTAQRKDSAHLPNLDLSVKQSIGRYLFSRVAAADLDHRLLFASRQDKQELRGRRGRAGEFLPSSPSEQPPQSLQGRPGPLNWTG